MTDPALSADGLALMGRMAFAGLRVHENWDLTQPGNPIRVLKSWRDRNGKRRYRTRKVSPSNARFARRHLKYPWQVPRVPAAYIIGSSLFAHPSIVAEIKRRERA